MRLRLRYAALLLAPVLMADFPLNGFQVQQADDLWAGLHGKMQEGTQYRLDRVAWWFADQTFKPERIDADRAAKLVSRCTHTDSSQTTRESLNYFMSCDGRNAGITFRSSDGVIVSGEIMYPPPIILAPNPEAPH